MYPTTGGIELPLGQQERLLFWQRLASSRQSSISTAIIEALENVLTTRVQPLGCMHRVFETCYPLPSLLLPPFLAAVLGLCVYGHV
jgi:hypothetical protein